MKKENDKGEIRSISRSALILECMCVGKHTLTEIAKYSNCGKSTAHRLLKALEVAGLVRQDNYTRCYYLGPLFDRVRLSNQIEHERLITCAFEEMNRLSNVSGESVSLGVCLGLVYVPVHEIPSKHDLRITQESTKTAIVFTGVAAKVLLSQSNDEELKKMIKVARLDKTIEKTIENEREFLEQIRQVRKQGYALNLGEKAPGVISMAAPIKNYYVPAAISIIGPEYRLKDKANALIPEIIESTNRISENIANYYSRYNTNFNDAQLVVHSGI